jgi:hypothetical protein
VGGVRLRAVGVAVVLALPGCSDQVIGYFDGSGTASVIGSETESLTAAPGDGTALDGDSASGVVDGSGDTSTVGFVPPGCFGDDFEDGVIDPDMWNTWTEENSNLEEVGGWLKFTPPTFGIFDTGVISNHLHVLPFRNASARMQIVAPPVPGRSVVLFLQIIEAPMVLSINVSEGVIVASASNDTTPIFSESFPAQPYPGWMGIRAEDDLVHFEVSDDGVTWSILGTYDKPAEFGAAQPLVMAQTYGEDLVGGIVAIDNFEACAQ